MTMLFSIYKLIPIAMRESQKSSKPFSIRIGHTGCMLQAGIVVYCLVFEQDRQKFLPSTENDKSPKNFIQLLKSDKIATLRGLAKFLNIPFGVFE